ncbi:MAG: hypothetical protein JXN60_03620 [Lentisphaerae bacterium]|nr:hypothetical protein [Lentisphaerota bacterium]
MNAIRIRILPALVIVFWLSGAGYVSADELGGEILQEAEYLAEWVSFYASFDKGADADYAKGDPKKLEPDMPVTQGEGIAGKGLKVTYVREKTGKGATATIPVSLPVGYKLEGNLFPQAGAISLWLKVLPGNIDNSWFFYAGSPRYNFALFAQTKEFVGGVVMQHICSGRLAEPWQAGEWHHVAATWRGNIGALYCDGKKLAETTKGARISNGTVLTIPELFQGVNDFWIGAFRRAGTSGFRLGLSAEYDELIIFSRDLAEYDVGLLYRLGKEGSAFGPLLDKPGK